MVKMIRKVRGTAPIGQNGLAPGGVLNLKDASYKHRHALGRQKILSPSPDRQPYEVTTSQCSPAKMAIMTPLSQIECK